MTKPMDITFRPSLIDGVVPDEVIITDPLNIHIERMGDGHIWLGIGHGDNLVHFNFVVTSEGNLMLRYDS